MDLMKKSLKAAWKLAKKIHPASMDILMTSEKAAKKGMVWDSHKREYAASKKPSHKP